uniref:Uncharacterized protein n=1 Tax=Coccidioides posadasii RMSCC 3488 TaxID=454284 RepID=A0A0J6F3Y7_COCPO|nr:hypothetical protein CPAG_03929 [Coccidioides posadasii RMSCC 3488]
MESQAKSIWLGRGTGPVWRRRLTAYSKPGCVPEYRIGGLSEKSGRYMDDKGNIRDGGNCIELDHLYLGAPGVEQQFDVRLIHVPSEFRENACGQIGDINQKMQLLCVCVRAVLSRE